MPPAIVLVQRKIYLHERPPFRALRFADKIESGLERRAVGLARVARDARADDIFPRRRAAAIARDDVVEVQIFPLENFPAVLAGVLVAFKNVVSRKFHFLLRHPVIHEEQNNFRDANAKRNRVNGIIRRRIGGDIRPFLKIKSAERTVGVIHHYLSLTLEEERERATCGANIDGLP